MHALLLRFAPFFVGTLTHFVGRRPGHHVRCALAKRLFGSRSRNGRLFWKRPDHLVDRLFPEHTGRVRDAFAVLDEDEKRSLASICRKLAA